MTGPDPVASTAFAAQVIADRKADRIALDGVEDAIWSYNVENKLTHTALSLCFCVHIINCAAHEEVLLRNVITASA